MAATKPKILFFTSHCPHAAPNGAHLRTLHIARFLQECGDLRLVLAGRWPFDSQAIKKAAEEFKLCAVMNFIRVPRRSLAERLRYEFDPFVLNTHNAAVSVMDEAKLASLMEGHDLAWFYGVHIPNALKMRTVHRSVLDVDDVPSQYYRSCLRTETNPIRRMLLRRQIALWRRREGQLLNRFNLLGVSSTQDREYFHNDARVHMIPNGFEETESLPKQSHDGPSRVGFIGDCSYPPNKEGITWFVRAVWPLVKRRIPDARLRVVGNETANEKFQEGQDIDGLGYVDDPAAEINTWSVMAVPILTGGGTRVKIAEAFSRGCPVVSTSMGAYGYDVTHKQELLLADHPKDFADACCNLICNQSLAQAIVKSARDVFQQRYAWQAIKPSVYKVVEHCLALP